MEAKTLSTMAEGDADQQPAAAAKPGRTTAWGWLRQRPTWMSFAMFFMLVCGGLQLSAMGPALPIIEKQLHLFAVGAVAVAGAAA